MGSAKISHLLMVFYTQSKSVQNNHGISLLKLDNDRIFHINLNFKFQIDLLLGGEVD